MDIPPFADTDILAGVLYAEDFDAEPADPAPRAAPEPAPEPVEPSFTAGDIARAQAEARAAGRIEAENGLLASRVRMLELVATGLTDAREAAAAVAEARAEAVSRIILAAMVAVLPALCRQHGAGELRSLVRAVLPDLVDEPRITVRVSPHLAHAMGAEIAALDAELAARVDVVPTDTVPLGDARITWQDGQAVRDAGQARRTVEDALATLGLLKQETQDA